ncbi:hypothetical protein [[Phormidium] sp. ETS-05]|uniref:hypothetical protein n=1 Tax=[Phormidium] sp. ETS-05 TaxID=222819 RepID=UPI0018EEE9B3|nr:hypothetical protein [[Phormidium] sp. ETS-05]
MTSGTAHPTTAVVLLPTESRRSDRANLRHNNTRQNRSRGYGKISSSGGNNGWVQWGWENFGNVKSGGIWGGFLKAVLPWERVLLPSGFVSYSHPDVVGTDMSHTSYPS